MTVQLDYLRAKAEAKKKGISVFLEMRRQIGFRLLNSNESNLNNCLNCVWMRNPVYNSEKKNQCELIGIGNDFYCNVDNKHTCVCFKKI